MEKPRTLPPLVRGKVTAVLGLFVDKIIVENISLLMDTFELVVQVQWWGEDLPTYIRPNKACYQQGTINRNFDSMDMNFQCATYEIKTTLDLFKLYLTTTEVLELCVFDVVKRCIIGSAFLRDLVNLLNKSNNFITAPIFNYLGEEIGELVICFCFLDKSKQNSVNKNEVIGVPKNNYTGKLDMQDLTTSNRIRKSFFTSVDNNFCSNRYEKFNYGSYTTTMEPSVIKSESKKNNEIDYVPYSKSRTANNLSKSTKEICRSNVKVHDDIIYSCKYLPEITTSNDSSKVLYFGLSSQENRKQICGNKFKSNSVKFRNKSKGTENFSDFPDHSSHVEKSVKNWQSNPVFLKNSKKTTAKVMDTKTCNVSSMDKLSQSEKHSSYNQFLVKDIPSQQTSESKVLDFLLGSDLSKEDEESALNEFKKMSPSHNLVISLNQLCLTSDSNDSRKSTNRYCTDSLGSPQLTFDFNNPIERNYYEKFFLNSEFSPNLKLNELPNQPENRVVLEKLKYEENVSNKEGFQFNSFKSSEHPLGSESSQKPKSDENFLEDYDGITNNTKRCAQCKYYKKLDELDKVIESLKHFETKIHTNENLWNQH